MEQQAPRGWKSPAAQVLHGKCKLIETPLFFFFFPSNYTLWISSAGGWVFVFATTQIGQTANKKKKTSDQISAENVYRTCFPPLTSCSSHSVADAENPLQTWTDSSVPLAPQCGGVFTEHAAGTGLHLVQKCRWKTVKLTVLISRRSNTSGFVDDFWKSFGQNLLSVWIIWTTLILSVRLNRKV